MSSNSQMYVNNAKPSDNQISEKWVEELKDLMNWKLNLKPGDKPGKFDGVKLNKSDAKGSLHNMQEFCKDKSLTWDDMLDKVTPEQFKNAYDELKQEQIEDLDDIASSLHRERNGNDGSEWACLLHTDYYEVLFALGIKSSTLKTREDDWKHEAEGVEDVENDTVENDTPSAAQVHTSDENTGCPSWLIPAIVVVVILALLFCVGLLWKKCKSNAANASISVVSDSHPTGQNQILSSTSGSFLQRHEVHWPVISDLAVPPSCEKHY